MQAQLAQVHSLQEQTRRSSCVTCSNCCTTVAQLEPPRTCCSRLPASTSSSDNSSTHSCSSCRCKDVQLQLLILFVPITRPSFPLVSPACSLLGVHTRSYAHTKQVTHAHTKLHAPYCNTTCRANTHKQRTQAHTLLITRSAAAAAAAAAAIAKTMAASHGNQHYAHTKHSKTTPCCRLKSCVPALTGRHEHREVLSYTTRQTGITDSH
jgi:hypothetical protein